MATTAPEKLLATIKKVARYMSWVPLMAGQEVIGAVLRSRAKVKPVFVSPGHRLSLETSLEWVIRCLGPTKLPEPTRLADRLASRRDQKKR